MKIASIKLMLKRDVRLAKYNVSQCAAEMEAHLSPEDDPQEVYEDLHASVKVIVTDMIKEEKEIYKESLKSAIKNQS